MIDKIRPDIIVDIIMHRMMGEEKINGKWVSLEQLKPRALTFRGAWEITSVMLPASSQNVSISKLTDSEIRERTSSIMDTVMQMCLRNWKEYGITGSDQIKAIKEIVITNTFITLKHPEGAGIQSLIKNTTQEMRSVSSEEKQPSFLSGLIRR